MNKALEKLKELGVKLRDSGFPVILLQDPLTKKPSITFTLFLASGLMALLALIGKAVTALGGIDFTSAKELLLVTGGIYLGRQFQKLGSEATAETEKKEGEQ